MSGRNSVVECQLPKLDVAGSSPVARSNETPISKAKRIEIGKLNCPANVVGRGIGNETRISEANNLKVTMGHLRRRGIIPLIPCINKKDGNLRQYFLLALYSVMC
jgi:hypothetical protein